ncbi:hypothetical protein SARC_09567 [Sphaeroforma arctica JP610]|uniref:GFO/IDH/MocA-like oxidoreductase domain-containing protein n=1 Tax=Sphaeroforma arctica JP610 TaxID=667725 RepID=A0A0L0FMK5_9EUKA|nr:hypothetical protein SARC_09567 [Sphaeroforma arctica JP610]KNC77985.1 hypothetical protein SARC_09567 [Sphaeroforma arctica JP610]|eukprot:XP_014151887.1 hypothetical protein SARC_09567 [Sphaeroforma arctica JP610]
MTVTYNHLKPKWVQKEGQDTPWRLLPKHSGGGLVMDVGVHSVDIIDFLIGPMRDIRGTATKRDDSSFVVEDDVFFTGKFGEKGEVSMKWDFNGTSGTHKDDIVITGSRGKMYLSCFNYTPICVEYTTVRDLESIRERVQSKEEHVFERPEHAHQGLVQLICNELRGGEASPSTGESAIRVADIMDDVLNEFYDGKRREAFWE